MANVKLLSVLTSSILAYIQSVDESTFIVIESHAGVAFHILDIYFLDCHEKVLDPVPKWKKILLSLEKQGEFTVFKWK